VGGLQACRLTAWPPRLLVDADFIARRRSPGNICLLLPRAARARCDHLQLIDRATHLAGIAIEHHRAKTELRAAETRYRTLVERLPAITYIAEVGVEAAGSS